MTLKTVLKIWPIGFQDWGFKVIVFMTVFIMTFNEYWAGADDSLLQSKLLIVISVVSCPVVLINLSSKKIFHTSLSIRKVKINFPKFSILSYHISKPDRFIQNAIQTLLGCILACFCKCWLCSVFTQRRIQNPLKHLRWRVLQKYLTAKSR